MSEKFTYHYHKSFAAAPEKVFAMFKRQLYEEFPSFDEVENPNASRMSKMRGYTSQEVVYNIKIVSYQENKEIEIHCDTTQEVYVTRYVFEETEQGTCFHVYETMHSEQSRISLNYKILSFFVRFGKKKKWRLMIQQIENYLQEQHRSACVSG